MFRIAVLGWVAPWAISSAAFAQQTFDVVVYGGTAAGVISAVSAARQGMSVALVEPGKHLGGMASGGLSATDFGNKGVIGGYAREFYKRVGARYETSRYGNEEAWYYEPHIGEMVFGEMVREAGVKVFLNHRLREKDGVRKKSSRITMVVMENGASFQARVFIDCSYEGDLMAQAGASYTGGREAEAEYGETLGGVREVTPFHQWNVKVSAYDERFHLLPEVWADPPGKPGTGDKKIQAYNFRLCLAQDPANRIPIPKPENYDPRKYELLARLVRALAEKEGRAPGLGEFVSMIEIPHGKADFNNNGAFSTDYIGLSWQYPEASYLERDKIWKDHADYDMGFFYFLAHDPRIPEELRQEANSWGLAKDEFTDTNHWPHQLYVREARRLVGEYVMTQRDLQTNVLKPDAIGMGSYNIDSHNVYRYVTPAGDVANEGDTQTRVDPYQIPYRALLPKRAEVENLLVPVCVSATHVAFSSLRMEPQYMIMGQAAGVAASIAVRENKAVQDVGAAKLAEKLEQDGAVLNYQNRN